VDFDVAWYPGSGLRGGGGMGPGVRRPPSRFIKVKTQHCPFLHMSLRVDEHRMSTESTNECTLQGQGTGEPGTHKLPRDSRLPRFPAAPIAENNPSEEG